jgi:hypothetical protein
MAFAAFVTWLIGALVGLCLVAIWLIEYDASVSATRLPRTVVGAHGLLAVGGLGLWYVYLATDVHRYAWAAGVMLAAVALLGLILGRRWIGVYRAHSAVARRRGHGAGVNVPPERHLPVPVVIAHGLFAGATIVLVVLTALTINRS